MANSRNSKKRRTTEAKLLITAASIAATVAGVGLFATQFSDVQAQNQAIVANNNAGGTATDNSVPAPFDEQEPSVEPTTVPVPSTGQPRGRRGSRWQSGQGGQGQILPNSSGQSGQSMPNSLGTTRSSR